MKSLDYAKTDVPSDYKCAKCGATGCKLWREYETTSPQLLCVDCACTDQKKVNNVDEEGIRTDGRMQTDQIGWYVPAVPTPNNQAYWGYGAVTDDGCGWWRRLPLRPARAA